MRSPVHDDSPSLMRPTPRATLLFCSGFALAALPALAGGWLWPAWLAWMLTCVAALGIDVVLAPPLRSLQVDVHGSTHIEVGTVGELNVSCSSSARVGVSVDALIDVDALLERCEPARLELAPGGRSKARFVLKPLRRGRANVERLWLRWTGPLGVMARAVTIDLERHVDVVPNLGPVRSVALQLSGHTRREAGIKSVHYLGDGSEFESLRAYVPGLDTRSIDWKSSARQGRLVCREFRAERNHAVVLAFDTGRLMSEPLEGVPRLDHAVTNGLALAWCCLRGGDRVGLYGFDSSSQLYMPPLSGAHAFATLQARTAELAYTQNETNYALGLIGLTTRLRRRSLVVVFTDFVDSVTADVMVDHLGRLSRRHLVLFVALSDPLLTTLEEAEPRTLRDVPRAVVAADLHSERRAVMGRLRRRGVHVVEARPGEVSMDLINSYFEIKRREQL